VGAAVDHRSEIYRRAAGVSTSPDPRKSLNRHDACLRATHRQAKAAKDEMFPIFPSKNAKPVSGAFRSFVRCPPHDHFGFGDLGALAVDIFGLG